MQIKYINTCILLGCLASSATPLTFSMEDIHICNSVCLIPLFHTGPGSHELPRIDKYLDSWLNRTQFVKILTFSHSP